jgi:hypothetical protein
MARSVPSPMVMVISPSCETVDHAISSLMSLCPSAHHEPQTHVTTPMGTSTTLQSAASPQIG